MDWTLLPSVILAILGGVIWAVRLEGRVNQQEAISVERGKSEDERSEDMKDRLQRIETKLDTLCRR